MNGKLDPVALTGEEYDALLQKIESLKMALYAARYALRAPLDDWKGHVEATALKTIREALGENS